MPAVDVPREIRRREGFLQPLLVLKGRRVQAQAGAPPDPRRPVVRLEPAPQRRRRRALKPRVHGRADGKAAGEERILSEAAGKLAADFVREIAARRQARFEGSHVAAEDRAQSGRRFRLRRRRVEIAVLDHFLQNEVPPRDGALGLPDRMVGRRRFRKRGQIRGLPDRKLLQRLVEVRLGRSRDAVGVLPEENLVEVEFQYLVFRELALDLRRKDDFLDFPVDCAIAAQKEVLHHLLGYGGSAPQPSAARRVDRRLQHPQRVVALVGVEILVLRGDYRLLDDRRNLLDRAEQPPLLRELVDQVPFSRKYPADGRRLVA